MSICGVGQSCEHYVQAMKLCMNHWDHSGNIECFFGEENTILEEVRGNRVDTVQVAIKGEPECEWEGVCSLKFLKVMKDAKLLVADGLGNKYEINSSSVVSFE